MNCGVGSRGDLDPELLWLWCRPAATALIRPLAWEPPYAVGAALEKDQKKKKKIQKILNTPDTKILSTPKPIEETAYLVCHQKYFQK